jgi:glc operon protein GlcG
LFSLLAVSALERRPTDQVIDQLPRESYLETFIATRREISEEHMQTQSKTVLACILAVVIATATASAQQAPVAPPTTPYGAPIGLEAAKKVMAAAEAEATKNNWGMAIAILDSTGHIVMLHKLDNTQYGSIAVAEDKARSALYFRRPSKVFEDLVAQGGLNMRLLALRGASPLEGGIPLLADGKIIGAIGVSGATSAQDGQVAKAGADAAK